MSTVFSLMLFCICVVYCWMYFGPSEKMLLITVFCMSAKRKYLNIVLHVWWVCAALLFICFVLSYYVSLRSYLRVVVYVTMFGSSSIHFFVGGLLSYLNPVECPVCSMLPVSQDYPLFIATSVISNFYLYLVQNMICTSGSRITKKTEMI